MNTKIADSDEKLLNRQPMNLHFSYS